MRLFLSIIAQFLLISLLSSLAVAQDVSECSTFNVRTPPHPVFLPRLLIRILRLEERREHETIYTPNY